MFVTHQIVAEPAKTNTVAAFIFATMSASKPVLLTRGCLAVGAFLKLVGAIIPHARTHVACYALGIMLVTDVSIAITAYFSNVFGLAHYALHAGTSRAAYKGS